MMDLLQNGDGTIGAISQKVLTKCETCDILGSNVKKGERRILISNGDYPPLSRESASPEEGEGISQRRRGLLQQ